MGIKECLIVIYFKIIISLKLLTSKFHYFAISAVVLYSIGQALYFVDYPGIHTFSYWYAKLQSSERFTFIQIVTTIIGFFITFYILTINWKSEAFAKITLGISNEIHISVQKILAILNQFKFFHEKLIEAKLAISGRDTTTRKIQIQLQYIAEQKFIFEQNLEHFGASVNDLYSILSQHSYIFLVKNIEKQVKMLIDISSYIHLESYNYHVYITKDTALDFQAFANQVDERKIALYLIRIDACRECISRLSGFINGTLFAMLAPVSFISSFLIFKNAKVFITGIFKMNELCTVDKIRQITEQQHAASVQHELVEHDK